jgi:hypothetical protein
MSNINNPPSYVRSYPIFNGTNFGTFTCTGAVTIEGQTTFKYKTTTLAAAASTTLTSTDVGVLYVPQQTANNVVTLPAVAAGLHFKFICTATANGTNTLTISGAATGLLNGYYDGVVAAPVKVSFTAKDSLILGATAANLKPGDWAEFDCNGTAWYVRASSNGTASAWTAP